MHSAFEALGIEVEDGTIVGAGLVGEAVQGVEKDEVGGPASEFGLVTSPGSDRGHGLVFGSRPGVSSVSGAVSGIARIFSERDSGLVDVEGPGPVLKDGG